MPMTVSILVFVELALDDDRVRLPVFSMVKVVSILVFVELALDGPNGCPSCCGGGKVSILVFVELALDANP